MPIRWSRIELNNKKLDLWPAFLFSYNIREQRTDASSIFNGGQVEVG